MLQIKMNGKFLFNFKINFLIKILFYRQNFKINNMTLLKLNFYVLFMSIFQL